jgi:hypothetical protein
MVKASTFQRHALRGELWSDLISGQETRVASGSMVHSEAFYSSFLLNMVLFEHHVTKCSVARADTADERYYG